MLILYVTVISTIGHVSFIKMDRFELMAAQLLLHLLPEHVEWCGDYYETVFVEEQRPVVLPAHVAAMVSTSESSSYALIDLA